MIWLNTYRFINIFMADIIISQVKQRSLHFYWSRVITCHNHPVKNAGDTETLIFKIAIPQFRDVFRHNRIYMEENVLYLIITCLGNAVQINWSAVQKRLFIILYQPKATPSLSTLKIKMTTCVLPVNQSAVITHLWWSVGYIHRARRIKQREFAFLELYNFKKAEQ